MNSEDGFDASSLFDSGKGYSFGDFILLPNYYDFGIEEVLLQTRLTRNISLNIPIVSSPMDSVTEADMAIALALLGGLGFIHFNCTVEEQCAIVRKVKKYENGFIADPVVLSPRHCITDIDRIKKDLGFSGIPITADGTLGSRLMGIVTTRDIDFVTDRSRPLSEVMTTDLVVAKEGISLEDANLILTKYMLA